MKAVWSGAIKKEILWQDIEKGLKLATGKYFIATKESIAKLRPEKSDIISIIEFLEAKVFVHV